MEVQGLYIAFHFVFIAMTPSIAEKNNEKNFQSLQTRYIIVLNYLDVVLICRLAYILTL